MGALALVLAILRYKMLRKRSLDMPTSMRPPLSPGGRFLLSEALFAVCECPCKVYAAAVRRLVAEVRTVEVATEKVLKSALRAAIVCAAVAFDVSNCASWAAVFEFNILATFALLNLLLQISWPDDLMSRISPKAPEAHLVRLLEANC